MKENGKGKKNRVVAAEGGGNTEIEAKRPRI